MATNTEDPELVEAFLDALDEMRDADEFERLMIGDTPPDRDVVWERLRDTRAAFMALPLTYGDATALEELKGRQALARLTERYPDVWARVALGEGGA